MCVCAHVLSVYPKYLGIIIHIWINNNMTIPSQLKYFINTHTSFSSILNKFSFQDIHFISLDCLHQMDCLLNLNTSQL